MSLFFGLRLPSGALVAGETTTPPAMDLSAFSSATVFLSVTTLTLPDADDEVDFYIQVSYNGGVNWTDVQNVHFTNADDGTTPLVLVVIDGANDGKGRIQSRTGADPAAGAELSEAVPANTIWRVTSMRGILVTATGGGSRRVSIVLDDGATSFYQQYSAGLQAASLTHFYDFATTGSDRTNLVQGTHIIPLPINLMLRAGFRLRTFTTLIQAGDNWGAPQLSVEAWHDPNVSTDGTMGDNLKSYRRPLGAQIRIRTAVAGATAPTYAYSADMLLK